jgi:hypothetical protein
MLKTILYVSALVFALVATYCYQKNITHLFGVSRLIVGVLGVLSLLLSQIV